MILDYVKNYKQYTACVPGLEEGMAFVETLKDKAPGRYEQGTMYALVQEGLTSDAFAQEPIETHREYIDVQFVMAGRELMEWTDSAGLRELAPYDEKKDAQFYTGEATKVIAEEGMFYILFPHDAHKCRGAVQTPEAYRKVVLKLKVSNR